MLLGNGTAKEPYQIGNAADLRQVNQDLSARYQLMDDIDLKEEFAPLGSQFEPFTGYFNGNGHVIRGLTMPHAAQYAGLFAFNSGVIENLCMEVRIEATAYVGSVAGYNDGRISNCTASGEITGTAFVGGLTGYNGSCGTVSGRSSCEVTGTVSSGKLAGYWEGQEDKAPETFRETIPIFVATDGCDQNEGGVDRPLATLLEAQKRVRSLTGRKVSSDITVFLRGGVYFLDAPLELTELDCLPNGHFVTYRNYEAEEVTLVGGKLVSGWAECSHGLKRAYVGTKADFRLLLVNGELKLPAKSETLEDLSEVSDLSHVSAYYSHGWFSEILRVSRIDWNKEIVETTLPRSAFSHELNYLLGAVPFVKNEGDWALGTDGYLYYFPLENDPMEIVVPSGKRIFSICGKDRQTPVEHIAVEGLTLTVTDLGTDFTAQGGRGKEGFDDPENTHGAVYLENARDCAVTNNHIKNCGVCGVAIQGSCVRNRIESNRIEAVGFAGIHLCGTWIDTTEYINRHNVIADNHILNVGKFAVNGAGIYIIGSGHNHVYRNLIHDTPRYGVSIKGARYDCWPSDCGYNRDNRIPFERHFAYLHSRNNVIEGNEVYDAGKRSLDGGGVEAWGPGRDNVIDRNRIYNFYNGVPTLNWKGHGIFLDDATHYFTVTNNIVFEQGPQGADASTFLKSIGIVVQNNIFDVTNTHQGAANISPYLDPCQDQVFVQNIVFADPKGGIGEDGRFIENGCRDRRVYTYDHTAAKNKTGPTIAKMDRNLYWNTCGKLLVSRDNSDPDADLLWEDFVKETGFDEHSLVADPLFIDATGRNYMLKADSPAFGLGFKQIDASKIGLIGQRTQV